MTAAIVHLWACPRPRPDLPGAGFSLLDQARHVTVFAPTAETWGYNHHAKLTWHNGLFHAMWSNHCSGEDGPGQRIRHASSPDGVAWSAPEILFDSPAPVRDSEEMGLSLTALQWLHHAGRLFAVSACHRNIGFTDFDGTLPPAPVRDAARPSRARQGYSPLVRELGADGAHGPVFALFASMADGVAFPVLPPTAPELATVIEPLRALHADVAWYPAWDFEGRLSFPAAEDGHRLCEPTTWRARDGRCVMLLRDTQYSHRMFVSYAADGAHWPPARPTDIPDSPSLATNTVLADGTVLLVGNQMAPDMDNAATHRHYGRDPLTVAVSPDGHVFTRVYALRCGAQSFRVPNVRGRGGGGQYPSAITRDGRLYVLYSMGKEDICLSSVDLADLNL